MNNTYIYGYGSLICTEARNVTGRDSGAWPVRVKGYKRFWTAHHTAGFSPLGVTPDDVATTNGVLVKVSEEELPRFDQREWYYRRELLPQSDIEYLGEQPDEKLNVWIYIPQRISIPTTAMPIIQSYVDVALTGCLAISQDFAVEFVRTTLGWNYPWINDRGHEQYGRALREVDSKPEIDSLLNDLLAETFSNRYP